MAFNNGALAYDEAQRSAASGNGQNIFDKMEFFMEAGCLCVTDIYQSDTTFFDEVVSAAASCAGSNGAVKTDVKVPATMGSGFGTCPSTLPFNGFAAVNKDQMEEAVQSMPKNAPAPPPPLAAIPSRRDLRVDVMLPDVKNKDVTTTAHKIALESALETALSLSANQVHILDVTRGAPNEFGAQEFDTTVLKVKITSATANTDLTSAELNAIHDTIAGAQGKAIKDEGLDLTASGYGYAEITSPTLTDGTSIPAPLDRGTVPQAQPSSGPKDLPAASTGLPRQGLRGTYEGGFEVTNEDYLLSLVGQGFPGIGMAILLVVVMILMIIVYIVATICGATCCKCCNGAYKPRKFSNRDLKINKVVILVFVALTAAGAFIVFSEGPKLMESTSDLTQAMADTISDLLDDVTQIATAMEGADSSMSAGGGAGGQMTELRDAADSVDETIQDAQDQIDEVLKQASDVIVISAGVMFGVTFFVFAAAFIGWWRLLILITVILSILMIVAWLVWGVVSIITVLVDDLCWAMQDYLDDAQASDLGDLIPCMDTKTAVETMNMAREMSFNGIVAVNSFLEDFGAENPAQLYLCYQFVRMRLDDLCNSQNPYYGEEYSEFICKGYRNNELTGSGGLDTKDDNEVYAFPKASCPYPTHFYEVLIGNFANEPTADPPGVRNLRCRFNMYELNANGDRQLDSNGDYVIDEFGAGQCYASTQSPADAFDDAAELGVMAQNIIDVLPLIEGMLRCQLVEDAFTSMVPPCNDMATALVNLYAGFLLISVGYFLVWASTLVIISRLQYYKTYCTDSDRYK